MFYKARFFIVFTIAFGGCDKILNNPPQEHYIGTWGPSSKGRLLEDGQELSTIPSITFDKNGNYFENGAQKGTYEVITIGVISEVSSTFGYRLRVHYVDNETITLRIIGDSIQNKFWEISVENSTDRGPSGFYDRLSLTKAALRSPTKIDDP